MKMELDRLLETFKVSSNIFGISSFVDMLFDLDHKSECSRNYEKRNSAEMQKISIKRLYRKKCEYQSKFVFERQKLDAMVWVMGYDINKPPQYI